MPSDSRMASLLHTRQRVLLQVTPLSKRNPWFTVRPSVLSCGSMWREVMALSTTAAPARAFSFTKFPLPKIRGYGVQMLWTPRKNMRRSTSPDPMTLPVSYSRTVSCHLQPRVWSWEWQLVTDDQVPASLTTRVMHFLRSTSNTVRLWRLGVLLITLASKFVGMSQHFKCLFCSLHPY